jgi:hypothetical protein
MKKLFVALSLAITICSIFASDDFDREICQKITMPSKKILKKRFKKSGLADFDQQNNLSDIFGEQELHPHEIIILASLHYKRFISFAHTPVVTMNPPSFPYIIGILLEDNPSTMECMKQQGIFSKITAIELINR